MTGYLLGGITVPDSVAKVSTEENGVTSLTSQSVDDVHVEHGDLFYVSPIFTVASGAPFYCEVNGSTTKYTHARLTFIMDAPGTINTYVGHTLSALGTAHSNGNFNFATPKTSTFVLRTGVTPSSLGTKVSDFLVLGSTGMGNQPAHGSLGGFSPKIIAPPGAKFLVEFSQTSGSPVQGSLIINWNETTFL